METPLVVNTSVDALSQHDLSSFTVQLLISVARTVNDGTGDQWWSWLKGHGFSHFRAMVGANMEQQGGLSMTFWSLENFQTKPDGVSRRFDGGFDRFLARIWVQRLDKHEVCTEFCVIFCLDGPGGRSPFGTFWPKWCEQLQTLCFPGS